MLVVILVVKVSIHLLFKSLPQPWLATCGASGLMKAKTQSLAEYSRRFHNEYRGIPIRK
tara:strand:+ start:20056 stop:20232 length:177 start_codon:yes stop_codon:yes gene_type:complete